MAFGTNSFWGVVLPVAKTNLMTNPSFERGTTGWGAIQGATVGSTADFQRFGAWAGSIAPTSNGTSGCLSPTFTFGNGTEYRVSFYAYTNAGLNYRAFVSDTSGAFTPDAALGGSVTWTGGGSWHQYSFNYGASSAAAHKLAIKKDGGGNTGIIYLDGVQVEVGSLTTYIDGDQEGCVWNGAPHVSASARSGQARAGGSIVALADLGFRVDESIGLGMPPLENTSQSYAIQPGAEFQQQRAGVRPFVLTSRVDGTTWPDFHAQRRAVINALKIDAVSEQQPTRFVYVGGVGTVQIDAVLDSGMEGGNRGGDGFGEDYGVRFLAFNPYFSAPVDQGTALVSRLTVGSMNYIVKRDAVTGQWGTMGVSGTTTTGPIYSIALNPSGSVFAAGSFDTAGGTRATHAAFWSHEASLWGTLGGGTLVGDANAMVINPNGTVFIGGNLTTAGGTAARFAAQWVNGAWGTLTNGTVNNYIQTMLYTSAGTLIAAGSFTSAGGTTAQRIAQWVDGAWGTLTNQGGNGSINNTVNSLDEGLDKKIYIGGAFGSAGGTAVNLITSWNGTFGTLSYGMHGILNPVVSAITTMLNGVLVAGGQIGTAGSTAVNLVAQWNGQQWTAMGSGLTNTLNGLYTNPTTGEVYAMGFFSAVDTSAVALFPLYAVWNGYRWVPGEVLKPSAGVNGAYAFLQTADQAQYLCGDFRGIGTVAAVSQVVNVGMSDAYPILRIRNTGAGTAHIYQCHNNTIGARMYFNLLIQSGEEVKLTFAPGSRSFISSVRGNIFSEILPGSNFATWRLMSGTNYISFLADSDSLNTSLYWRPRNWSADGTVI